MAVLILAPEEDGHARAVTAQLDALGVQVYGGTLGNLLRAANFALELGPSAPSCRLAPKAEQFWKADRQLNLAAVSAVWLRRPGRIKAVEPWQKWDGDLIECESNRAVQGLFRVLPALWVNDPAAQNEAAYKVRQLDIARSCGLSVPKTLITNNPAEVHSFYESCNRRIVYKLIDEASWQYFPDFEVPKGVPTLPFRESDLQHLEQVRKGMHLFQERIEKLADIRVTVVGNQLFPVKIDLLEGKSPLDFRLDYSVPMSDYCLPDEIGQKCIDLLKRLGLNFGAIDFSLAEDGRHVFLEINAAGQWMWMEKQLDLPISRAVARLLAGLDPPLVPARSGC